jgi:hypothetical protein
LKQILPLNQLDAHDVLREHPGFQMWDRHRSYETSFQIFTRAFADLIASIERFETAAADHSIFDRAHATELAETEQAIQKELFSAANAAASLVDHSRRVQLLANVPDYGSQLAGAFGGDDLHEFIIGLRVMLHHLYAARPGYYWEKKFEPGAKVINGFKFSRSNLMQAARDVHAASLVWNSACGINAQ